jgi:prepilin-type N-terminal cleavage/methylation domain-containing protein
MEYGMQKNTSLRRICAGMTLIELMVALGIGSFLMLGAVTVFVESRATFRITESVARLQENARFALDRMEPDIRMANYWGLTTRANKVQGRATPADPLAFPVAGDCGINWSVNLAQPITGNNNGFPPVLCNSVFSLAAQPTSDTLVIRRVAEDPVPAVPGPQAGTLYVHSARFQDSQLFMGPAIPPGYPAGTAQTHQLIVNGYYVSSQSSLGAAIPSLRVKTLTSVGGVPLVQDQEVLPGVEDMQIQFGIDTDAPGTPNRGSIDRYVNPGDPLLNTVINPNTEVLAVRLWLRVRAERREGGFFDTTNYIYADQVIPPIGDQFRRILVAKTIYLRNTRPAS